MTKPNNNDKNTQTVYIDVREPYEYQASHVEGAINIPPMKLIQGVPKELAGLPKDIELILYCHSGARSNTSMHFLRQYGFTNLVNGINQEYVEAKYLSAKISPVTPSH